MDVEITENGKEQSLKARQEVQGLDVDVVLVSPLRRALHTCAIVFEGHPSTPPIIVEPAFREIMESSNDIGSEIA
jgi:broad specificity phosphatase PhoE